MRSFVTAFTAALALAIGPMIALADGVATAQPRFVPSDWTGVTFGVEFGAGQIADAGGADSAQIYGLRAGYRRDLGDLVLGVRIVYDYIEVPGLVDTDNHYTALHLTAGADMGRWQPYVIGGFASLTFRDPAPRRSDRGLLAGVGVAWQQSPDVVLAVEAIHHFNEDFAGGAAERSGDFIVLAYDYRF